MSDTVTPGSDPTANELQAALAYASNGRSVFPARRDKRPLVANGFKAATTDADTIRSWWERWPDAGIATPTGHGWFALDVDDEQAFARLIAEHEPLPPTVEVVTPRPGRHLYLRAAGVSNGRGRLPQGLDVRGLGGYVLLPPSLHENGVYEWRTAPDEVPIASAPAWLLELLTGTTVAAAVQGDIAAGQRNATLTSMAGTMRRRGFSERAIAEALLVENADRCAPPLREADVHRIARSIARYVPEDDAVASVDELTALLGLGAVGKRIDRVAVFGRGSKATVQLHLDGDEHITLDPLGSYATPAKLTLEMAATTGATPKLKGPDVALVTSLIYRLGQHHEAFETRDVAWEVAQDYLRDAATGEVDMNDQADRWRAFCALERSPAQNIVLKDETTGHRLVRVGWFAAYARQRTGTSEPILHELRALGWTKRGAEGRIKATQPGLGRSLIWKFFVVPEGWEE